MVPRFIQEYSNIGKHILYVIAAEYFLQLIGTSFLSILPLYMKSEGYSDGAIAGHISFRFLGVLVLALPLGFFIRSRKLIPMVRIACTGVPFFSLIILLSIHAHNSWLLSVSQFCWGASMIFMQATVIPYILRNSNGKYITEAIALSYATFSIGGISGGMLIGFLHYLNPVLFSDRNLLLLVSIMGFAGVFFLSRVNSNETVPLHSGFTGLGTFNWGRIAKGLAPTLVIAIGAGLTIPFISLFFSSVHGFSSGDFASMSAAAYILVSTCYLLVPRIKKKVGYRIAIPGTQSLAIVALVVMATTQYYSHLSFAWIIAMVFYLVRQPLMNLAQPMTTEIVMAYAGEKNREMVSALTGAAWSGSWYISSIVFKRLSNAGFSYVTIFLLTASVYCVGVVWYSVLIRAHDRQERNLNG